ncbi:MAG TPA: hypothetical protein VFO16_23875, partial [Pseudonocardiaceae bacterium]|nr:hypothetical protein [Pseudonocardiaceae bacterium]
MASRLVRANAVTVGDVLDGHTLLEIDCVDRVYLTLSVPSLVVGGQVVSFLTAHEKNPIPSPALLERRGLAFRRAVASLAEANDIPVLSFAGKRDRGRPGVLAESPWPERKIDKVMPLMRKAAATGRSQVVAIGGGAGVPAGIHRDQGPDPHRGGVVLLQPDRTPGHLLLLLRLGRRFRAG